MKPAKTVCDSELFFLAQETRAAKALSLEVPLVALGTEAALKAKVPPVEARRVSVKLITALGDEDKAVEWIRKEGGTVVSHGAQVLVADLPSTTLASIDQQEFIKRAEAPRHLQFALDEARGPATGLNAALETHELSGEGVVVGVIDSGIDWQHPDFRQTTDQALTRIEYFLHAHRPEGQQQSIYDEFTQEQINDTLGGSGIVPQGDPHGHGTHCASIAAGNGAGSNGTFRGVAPNATLMAVRSEPLLDPHIIKGIREIFQRAGDRPAVINLSLGGHWGPHDGTSAIENVIARESGPGQIVVVAAGNEGGDRIHWQGDLEEGEVLEIPFTAVQGGLQWVDVWIPRGDDVDIEIETPDGVRHEPTAQVVSTVFGPFIADWRQDPINLDQNLTLRLAPQGFNHTWTIRLTPQRVFHGNVHAWSGTQSGARQLFPNVDSHEYSIGIPATEERALAVASFVSKNSFAAQGGTLVAQGLGVGQLSPFSSHGPTRYGRLKPDVAAPGQYITAALSSNSLMATDPRYTPRHHPTGNYITIQGTSMATPFVVGVIALMLQREPGLTPEEVQQRLRVTARRDEDTERVWNPAFGFGKIDVEELLNYGPG